MLHSLMASLHKPIYEHRLKVLVGEIVRELSPGDLVLDVGCGNGTLGRAIMDHPQCPKGVVVEGLERAKRGNEPITVHAYDGVTMPLADRSYDVTIVADVLHHEPKPERLLAECVRVSRKLVVIKDHRIRGPISRWAVCLIDWAANAPYGVPCLFRYNTLEQWRALPGQLGTSTHREVTRMDLYPPLVNLFFGGGLQYMTFQRVPSVQVGCGGGRIRDVF